MIERKEKTQHLKVAKKILSSLSITNVVTVNNENQSLDILVRYLEKYNFKSERSLEIELLDFDSKKNIVKSIDSLLKILCTSEELDDLAVGMRADIYILWNIRDYLNELLAKN